MAGMQVTIPRAVVTRTVPGKPDKNGVIRQYVTLALDDNSQIECSTALLTAEQAEQLRLQLVSLTGTLKVSVFQDEKGKRTNLEFVELQVTRPKSAAS